MIPQWSRSFGTGTDSWGGYNVSQALPIAFNNDWLSIITGDTNATTSMIRTIAANIDNNLSEFHVTCHTLLWTDNNNGVKHSADDSDKTVIGQKYGMLSGTMIALGY